MSKRQVIMILSALTAVIQFLGFPTSWNKFFTFVCGLLIFGVAYLMAPKVRSQDVKDLPYVEQKREEIL